MLCSPVLLQMKPFQALPPERLDWICERAEHISLKAGEVLAREGDPPQGFFIQVQGQTTVSRKSNGVDMPIGQNDSPAFFGEIQVLTHDPLPVTFTANVDTELYRLKCPDFLDVLHSCREFERDIFRTVGKRVRGLESFIQSREKMAALGTLAAGLAHELNNPAAALVRALKDIQPAMLELQRMNLLYGQQQVDDAHTQDWEEIRDRGFEAIAHPVADPLAQSDREDALLDWLEDYGVENVWELAEPLASGHVEPKQLEAVTRPWKDYSNELRDMGIRWLALSFDVMGMVHNGLDGAERISTLVQSMKSYAYMDQAARQCINIHDGLDATLRLFSFKLKQNITVERHYDSDLPVIPAFGSELNQVWTNLIDNAIHALCDQASSGKTAKIIIRTGRHKDCLRVDIEDNGPGIPAEIKTRIMEPFFTTKPMGQGSGLGLDVVRRIVENRHSGSLMIQSEPGRTCFCVLLPLCPDDSER